MLPHLTLMSATIYDFLAGLLANLMESIVETI